jgi:hypothetical protein
MSSTPTTSSTDSEIYAKVFDMLVDDNAENPGEVTEKVMALIRQDREAREDAAFREGQRVGQYQAADKLYYHTTHMWMFKDDLMHHSADMPRRISDMNKDCEKLLNHNSKVYHAYVMGERYRRLHPAPDSKSKA